MGLVMQPASDTDFTPPAASKFDYAGIVAQIKSAGLAPEKFMEVANALTANESQALMTGLRGSLKVTTKADTPVGTGKGSERRKLYARPFTDGEKAAQDARDAERKARREANAVKEAEKDAATPAVKPADTAPAGTPPAPAPAS